MSENQKVKIKKQAAKNERQATSFRLQLAFRFFGF